ncbi:MAG: biotin-dependent carboxyltransferase family protein [Desulfobacterales bacterium]
MEAIRIHAPGPYTTVQDLGRRHYFHLGVPVSGSLDDYAHRVANWLVGNPGQCAVLELSVAGGRMEMLCPADIAVTGAMMNPRLNGIPIPTWSSIRVKAGDMLELGMAENGCRAYLAITGGIDVPEIMGSRSTFVGSRLGGVQGRPLTTGDVLLRGDAPQLGRTRRLAWRPIYPDETTLRVVPGPHDAFFRERLGILFESDFTVSANSNRMGYRLEGPELLRDPDAPQSILSVPVTPGNIQVPADGRPIILLREQTVGGYTIVATVISPDLFRIAQAKPGDSIRFRRVELEEAHRIARDWARFLRDVEEDLARSPAGSAEGD